MDEESLSGLVEAPENEVCSRLKQFISKHAKTFTFPDMSRDSKERFFSALAALLSGSHSNSCYALCLECIRIISRDKTDLDRLATDHILDLLLEHSAISCYASEEVDGAKLENADQSVMIEAQNGLCNIIYNSRKAQRYCSQSKCINGIVQRLKTYKDPDVKWEIKFYDMKILFLLTALCADIRPKLRFELHGLTYLIEVLDLCVREAEDLMKPLDDKDADLCSEVLKVLFNLTLSVDKTKPNKLDTEEEAHFMRLVSVLHDLLLIDTVTADKRIDLQSHTVNLLTNMPRDCYEELLTVANEGISTATNNKDVEYDGKNMEAVMILLEFLYIRVDCPSSSLIENLTPILHCLAEACRANRYIRKFCRMKVLPPLRSEVKALPEEGSTLRNKLCRLLTSPITEVKEFTADFLFVLCKESVARMIKYTGYGNSAGLLARKGLLLEGSCSSNLAEYSSDSEESDTEEYAQLRDMVNPITGRWETDPVNPLEGMSDEQKEYEAVQLANMMDKLCSGGVIQPCCIGADGKPQPIESVLQLTERFNQPPTHPHHHQQQQQDSD
ncbi:chaperone Ric-8A-like isoform X1 [Tubulanus polymorphus]|uniref:chaperone Ric-8A-like isoform X1 n=1 Tax=Tubulanus polymorphus TaxID=672921 RepID=UPI003DA224D5